MFGHWRLVPTKRRRKKCMLLTVLYFSQSVLQEFILLYNRQSSAGEFSAVEFHIHPLCRIASTSSALCMACVQILSCSCPMCQSDV